MATYTPCQLAYLWIQAGGNAQMAPTMASIAMAESSGNSSAYNGICCYGLWQINANHGYSQAAMMDPVLNAQEAVAVFNSQGLGAWTTYPGMSSQFFDPNLQPCIAPVNATDAATNAQLASTGGQQAVDTGFLKTPCSPQQFFFGGLGSGPLGCIAQGADSWVASLLRGYILSVLNPIIQVIAGVFGVTAGLAIFLIGIVVLSRQTQAGRTATNLAADAGLSALAPEATAVTEYEGGAGITSVQQTRRPAGRIRGPGGRQYTYRPTRVRTQVTRPPTRSRTGGDDANDEATTYPQGEAGAA